MMISLDMVPRLPDGKLDTDSWTYRAFRSQDAWGMSPGAPVDGFFNLVLTPMIRALFNSPEPDEIDAPVGYRRGCEVLYGWTKSTTLSWSLLSERNTRRDYPLLRRMLSRTRWYQEVYRCKPGGFNRAWARLAVPVGLPIEEANINSDLRTWFNLHMAIGPEVGVVRSKTSRPRRAPTSQSIVEPEYPPEFLDCMDQLIDELRIRTPVDMDWCCARLTQLLEQLQARDLGDPVGPAEPIRIVEPEFVVDMEFDPKEPEES
jgi:hypothetical protein